MPFSYWLPGITSDYRFNQTGAEAFSDYGYRGKSKSLNTNISRVLHSNGSHKTTLGYEVITRGTHNVINNT